MKTPTTKIHFWASLSNSVFWKLPIVARSKPSAQVILPIVIKILRPHLSDVTLDTIVKRKFMAITVTFKADPVVPIGENILGA